MTSRLLGLLLTWLTVGCLVVPSASAQTDGIGVGATLGVSNGASALDRNPVGIAGKLWLSNRHALTGMTSFYLSDTTPTASSPSSSRSYWVVQTDYLFHNFAALSVKEGLLASYIGGGVQYALFDGAADQLALRGPVGVTYLLDSSPIDFFVEVAPTISVTDPVALRFDGAFGVRYFLSAGDADTEE